MIRYVSGDKILRSWSLPDDVSIAWIQKYRHLVLNPGVRGYFVSPVGVDEEKVLKYVEWQQTQD